MADNQRTTYTSSPLMSQFAIPNSVRDLYYWTMGQKFGIVRTEDGLLLQPLNPFPETTLNEVAVSLVYEGPPRSLADMEAAIEWGVHASREDQP